MVIDQAALSHEVKPLHAYRVTIYTYGDCTVNAQKGYGVQHFMRRHHDITACGTYAVCLLHLVE
jgi:hypothetical protein